MVYEKNLPKLRICNACEDTCPECFILKNKFRYLGSRTADEDDISVANADELPESFSVDEALLFDANLHAEQAQQQRNLAAERQQVRFVVVFVSSSLFLSLY